MVVVVVEEAEEVEAEGVGEVVVVVVVEVGFWGREVVFALGEARRCESRKLPMPRDLKEPLGCRFSSLR